MPFNLTLVINNKDDFARLAEMLGKDSVDIEGGAGFTMNFSRTL